MTTAKKMLEVAASYIGTKGDHNIFNKWYWVDYTKTYSHDPGTAWCACFQSYVAMKAKLKCKYSASASGFATQFSRIPVEKENTVQPGDIVIFNWNGRTDTGWSDHVGIVEWSTIGDDGRFGTIEGNTGDEAEGQVLRVTRTNWGSYFTAFYRPKYDAATATSAKSTAPSTSAKSSKVLYGIDVSSNQPENIFTRVKADFGIVKMSGNPQGYNWNYVNPYAKKQSDDIYKKTGMLGLYHFTWGKDANTEADFFVDQVRKLGYLGKAMLVIDYEAQAVNLGGKWVKAFADRVKAKAGYSPVIYASGSVIMSQDLARFGYDLWCANYYKGYDQIEGYDTSGMKIYPGCEKSVLWQFTSVGYLDGYSNPLDLDVFYGDKAKWQQLAGMKSTVPSKPDGKPKPQPTPAKKTVYQIAQEVIAGKWGNGEDRRKRLEDAGYSYDEVQEKVNEILSGPSKKSIGEIAEEVLAGKWGNGDDRKKRLTNAGYSYKKVQEEVNILLAVQDVIAGKYGNGQARIDALRRAGYDPDEIQERVNELLS